MKRERWPGAWRLRGRLHALRRVDDFGVGNTRLFGDLRKKRRICIGYYLVKFDAAISKARALTRTTSCSEGLVAITQAYKRSTSGTSAQPGRSCNIQIISKTKSQLVSVWFFLDCAAHSDARTRTASASRSLHGY